MAYVVLLDGGCIIDKVLIMGLINSTKTRNSEDKVKKPLRKIVNRRYWRTRNHPKDARDSVTCLLECGHSIRFKGSQEPSNRARCFYCEFSTIEPK